MTFIRTILKRIKVNQNFRRLSMIKELSYNRKSKAKIYGTTENLTVNHISNSQIN